MFPQRITSRRLLTSLLLAVALPMAMTSNAPTAELPGGRSADRQNSTKASETPSEIEGFTEPYADINMAAAEMGTLANVAVKDGDVVKSGQLIANLEMPFCERRWKLRKPVCRPKANFSRLALNWN